MARLKFLGKVEEYSPAYGLTLQVGEAEYPDEIAEALIASGRFHKALPPRVKKADADDEKGKD